FEPWHCTSIPCTKKSHPDIHRDSYLINMSSHHFVKEGQEPALLILDEVDSSLVQPLLEWSPLVIVAEAAVHHVLAWGIKIDVLLASDEGIDELKIAMRDQAP